MDGGYAGTSTATSAGERELAFTRVFDAPRELVLQAWTDPKHVAQSWGPNGFTTTIHEMDVRPGGVWRFVMHGPNGVDSQNRIVFLEIGSWDVDRESPVGASYVLRSAFHVPRSKRRTRRLGASRSI